MNEEWRKILESRFIYYQNLKTSQKKVFESRLNVFIRSREFVGKKIEITEEMKTLIGATAVQLTFGLHYSSLQHFRKIIVFPQKYFSEKTMSYHLGEVNTRGTISLSWKDFLKGNDDNSEAQNLGLHEMAHALSFETKRLKKQFGITNKRGMKKLNKIAQQEMEKIRQGEGQFLRKHAGLNEEEFFAVGVEYFFGKPKDLKREIPELYITLKNLLNQNPVAFPQHCR